MLAYAIKNFRTGLVQNFHRLSSNKCVVYQNPIWLRGANHAASRTNLLVFSTRSFGQNDQYGGYDTVTTIDIDSGPDR